MVSFVSASFSLSKESVGLALQCCLGGDPVSFHVFQLSDHRFWFFVASNLVGHFIHHLKSRIWLDFHCTFHLYHGDTESALLPPVHGLCATYINEGWSPPKGHAKSLPINVVASSVDNLAPVRFKPNLDFLRRSSEADRVRQPGASINFGSFSISLDDYNQQSPSNLVVPHLASVPSTQSQIPPIKDLLLKPDFYDSSAPTLAMLRDNREASYSNEDIQKQFGLSFMPDIRPSQSACPLCLVPGNYCHQNGSSCGKFCPSEVDFSANWQLALEKKLIPLISYS